MPSSTSSTSPATRQATSRAGLGIALSLVLLLTSIPEASAGLFDMGAPPKNTQTKRAARDFLPPVASINPRIDPQADAAENDLEPVDLHAVTSPVIHTTPKVARLDGYISDKFKSEQVQNVMDIQKKIDEADLEYLWRATVEKNPVIRFSLEKLSTPADLQPKQSSKFLTKTLSTLVSGASLLGSMAPGGGQYRDMAVMAGNNALQNLINGRNQPTPGALSATEQIQMAGLIDDLKMKLIQTYQNYKNTLQTLAESHQTTLKNNNMYSKALASKNDLAVMAAGTAYYQALMNETNLRQKAKLHRLALERLSGREAVSNLELTASLDAIQTAVNSAPTTNLNTVGPPAPKDVLPMDLTQPMEIGPSLAPEIGPPEPIPAAAAATRAIRNQNTTAPDALPQPMPEIMQHD